MISMTLLLIRRIDRRDRLWTLAGKAGLPLIILLVLPVWGSSFVLNPPIVVVFRNGIYWLMFLLGYYVFSHGTVLAKLKQHAVLFLIIAVGLV